METLGEVGIYQNQAEGILITNKLISIKGRVWPVANIASVAISYCRLHNRSCFWTVLFWFGILMLPFSIIAGVAAPIYAISIKEPFLLILWAFVGCAFWAFISVLIIKFARGKRYSISIQAGSRMEEVFVTKDEKLAVEITNCIQQAIAR